MTEHGAEVDELQEALAAAAQMRLTDADPHHVARWLNRYHRRCQGLEALLRVADRYLRFGMPEHELSEMRLLVARLRESERAANASVDVDSTLPL